MKLVHKNFDFIFDFCENEHGLLVIESPCLFRKLVDEAYIGNLCDFVLSEQGVILDIKKNMACVVDFFNISINERRLLNKLNEIINCEILNSQLYIKCNEMCEMLKMLADNICEQVDYFIEPGKKMDIPALIKFFDFNFQDENTDILSHLTDYVKINADMLKIKLFVFVNAYSYFDLYEIKKMLEYMNYLKVNALFVENKMPENVDEYKCAYVLDKDACIICLNSV